MLEGQGDAGPSWFGEPTAGTAIAVEFEKVVVAKDPAANKPTAVAATPQTTDCTFNPDTPKHDFHVQISLSPGSHGSG